MSEPRTLAVKRGSTLRLTATDVQGHLTVTWNGAVWFSADAPAEAQLRALDSGKVWVDMSAHTRDGKKRRALLTWSLEHAGKTHTLSQLVLDDDIPGATLRLAVVA